MSCDISSTILDPVQGLVDYVEDIKPYHSKVVEVIVEYQHNEAIEVTMVDALDLRVQILHPDPGTALVIGSCPVINKQIWGAINDQTDFVLDDNVPYLEVADEYNAAPGQTIFELSHMVNASDVNNISSITVNGTPTTSYVLNLGADSVTVSSPIIQRGDYVVISYQTSTPDASNFTVTVNGVVADVTLTSINTFTINSPLPLYTNDWVVATLCGPSVEEFICYDGYDTTVYDDPDTFVICQVNTAANTITVPRNRTNEFTVGTEIALKTNIIVTAGSPGGLIATDPADNLRVYTVLSSTYTAGTATTDPYTTIVVDATIEGIDPPVSVLNPGEEFIFTAGVHQLPLLDVLGYSDADDRPLETPNEGHLELDVVSINETTNTIIVDGDLSSSTLKAGDKFFVSNSTNHTGSYAISTISYGGSPGTTSIVVTEDIIEAEASGDSAIAIFDIMSNAFVIKGGVSPRFRQGYIFEIINGVNAGTYVTLTADITTVETGREQFSGITDGQVNFTLTGPLSIPGISDHATSQGVADSSLLSVKLLRGGEILSLGATVTSPTTFTVSSGPLPLLSTDEVIAIVSDRYTRVRVTDDLVPGAVDGILRDFPLGFGSQQVFCDQLPYTVVRVLIKEHLQFSNMSLDLTDDIIAYNLENTDQVVYDGIPQGTTFDPAPPSSPTVFDYWYPALPIADIISPSTIVIAGDVSSLPLSSYDITGSTTNTGSYTVNNVAAFDPVTQTTTLTIAEATLVNVPASDTTGMLILPATIATYPLAVYQWDGVSEWRLQQLGYNENKPAIGSVGFVGQYVWVATQDQVTYTLPGGSPYDFTLPTGSPIDTALISVTVNDVPVAFTVDSSITFTITSVVPDETDVIKVVVRDHINTELNAYVNPYDGEPHQVTHTGVEGDDNNSTFTLAGGNYLRRMTQELTLVGSGSGSPEGDIGEWRPTNYPVIAVDADANTITIRGDVSHIFTAGSPLGAGDVIMMHSFNNEEEFVVQSVVVGGSPLATTITIVDPNVDEYDVENPFGSPVGSPWSGSPYQPFGSPNYYGTPILQNYSKDLGWITAGTFNPSTQDTVIAVNPLDVGSPLRTLSDVDVLSYRRVGPLRFDIKVHQALTAAVTTTDAMGMAEEALGVPQLFEIIDVDLVNNTFTIAGDYRDSFITNTRFTIQGSYNLINNNPYPLGSPPVTSQWTVVGIGSPPSSGAIGVGSPLTNLGSPNDVTTIIKVAEPINTIGSPPDVPMPYGTIVLVDYVIASAPVNQTAATFEDTLFFGWGTTQRWQIVGQSASTNTIYLETDLTGMIYVNDAGNIVGSLYNDADYDVIGVSYDAGSDRTAVVLNGPIINVVIPTPSPGSPYGSPYYQDIEIVGSPAGLVGSPPVYIGSPRDYSLLGMFQLDNLDVTGWFQYNIINANVDNDTFVVQGNALGDIQAGQEFRIIGTPGNDGLYLSDTGAPPIFDGVNTTIIVDATSKTHITTSQGLAVGSPLTVFGSPYAVGGGVLQAARDYGIHIFHRDVIGTSVEEALDGPVPTGGENIVGSFDLTGFDQGTFDEDLNVLKFFTDPDEKP